MYIFHVGSVYSEKSAAAPLAGAAAVSRESLEHRGNPPPKRRARPEVICEVSREFIGLADKRRATLRILTYDRVVIVRLAYLLNGGS